MALAESQKKSTYAQNRMHPLNPLDKNVKTLHYHKIQLITDSGVYPTPMIRHQLGPNRTIHHHRISPESFPPTLLKSHLLHPSHPTTTPVHMLIVHHTVDILHSVAAHMWHLTHLLHPLHLLQHSLSLLIAHPLHTQAVHAVHSGHLLELRVSVLLGLLMRHDEMLLHLLLRHQFRLLLAMQSLGLWDGGEVSAIFLRYVVEEAVVEVLALRLQMLFLLLRELHCGIGPLLEMRLLGVLLWWGCAVGHVGMSWWSIHAGMMHPQRLLILPLLIQSRLVLEALHLSGIPLLGRHLTVWRAVLHPLTLQLLLVSLMIASENLFAFHLFQDLMLLLRRKLWRLPVQMSVGHDVMIQGRVRAYWWAALGHTRSSMLAHHWRSMRHRRGSIHLRRTCTAWHLLSTNLACHTHASRLSMLHSRWWTCRATGNPLTG